MRGSNCAESRLHIGSKRHLYSQMREYDPFRFLNVGADRDLREINGMTSSRHGAGGTRPSGHDKAWPCYGLCWRYFVSVASSIITL